MEVKCNLCGNNQTKPVGFVGIPEGQQRIFSTTKLTVVQCRKCGLIYTNPQPSQATLEAFYDADYSDIDAKNIDEKLANKRALCCGGGYVTYDLRFCKRLLNEINHLSKIGKMLDVGCGEAQFIKFARDNGWQVFGQELSNEAAKYAWDRFGLDVRAGDLISLDFPNDYFDVVVMLNVVEHFTDPIRYLNEVNRILRRGGVVYLTTPNTMISSNDYREFIIPEHLFRFLTGTIKAMLQKSGFEIIKCTTRNKQDTQIYLDILKQQIGNVPRLGLDYKTFLFDCYRLMNAALGIGIPRWQITWRNRGARITVFAKK